MEKQTEAMLLDNCMEMIVVFERNGTIRQGNRIAKEKTGYGEELLGKNVCDLYPLVFQRQGEEVLFSEKEEERLETSMYRSNQTCCSIEYKVLFYEAAGEKEGVIYSRDISKQNSAIRSRKEALEEVEATMKMKNEFVANVTHELRTPVNGIKGMAENLLDTVLTPSQIETVNIIVRCSNNMTKIINDLLDFSKIEAGKLTLENREFNFRKFINETMAFNAIRIQEKGLKLLVHVASDIPSKVIGDELRLGQVINNLFSNAIKFTAVGQIDFEVVSTYRDEEEIELFFVVADTGIGISEEEKDKLFKSFSQVDGSITRRFGGTGLGLAICKQLVELMNGSIHVDSEKGKGSNFSFSVRLKVADGEEEAEATPAYPEGKFIYHSPSVQTEQPTGRAGSFMEKLFPTGDFTIPSGGPVQFAPIEEISEEEEDNLKKAVQLMERLLLSMEMGTWEKAEGFAGMIKQLMPEGNEELKRKAFRLELAVRREDYEKAAEQARELRRLLEEKQELQ